MALGTITKLIADFASKYLTELGKKDCYLGGWISEDRFFLDVSNIETDRKRAHLLSLYRKELAIYISDINGGREFDNKPIEEMFEKSFQYKVTLEESERAHQSFAQLRETMRQKEEQLNQTLKELNALKKRKRPTSRSLGSSTLRGSPPSSPPFQTGGKTPKRRQPVGGLFTPDDSDSTLRGIHKESSKKDGKNAKASSPDAGTSRRKGSK